MDVIFFHRIKHDKTKTGTSAWDKGIEIKDTGVASKNMDDALQAYHAYLGAYAYGHSENIDYVACYITNAAGNRLEWEVWDGTIVPDLPTE